ncbi:hypothetical protein HAX54_030754 [Datura stramonium]|uniref:Uncharacterized protein n=1 Tax=Datura stramonium TaxID=4076 RepID=A0ABS8VAH2_DATST|nr:hypothetical protein [Datura stramonium]
MGYPCTIIESDYQSQTWEEGGSLDSSILDVDGDQTTILRCIFDMIAATTIALSMVAQSVTKFLLSMSFEEDSYVRTPFGHELEDDKVNAQVVFCFFDRESGGSFLIGVY